MRANKMLGVALLFFALMILYPVHFEVRYDNRSVNPLPYLSE